jgi:VTC domain
MTLPRMRKLQVATDSPSIIERREYKFLIDREMAARVRAAIAPFCALDPYAAGSPSRTYAIDTLYLDTRDLRLFWANDAELVDRIKLRVRSYADAPNSPMFFEVKRRINDVISKSRGKVSRALWHGLLADDSARIPDTVVGKDRMAVERFLAISRSMHVRPFTLVRYDREPYFSTIDDYARVTFDTRVRAHRIDELTFEPDGSCWRALDDAVMQRQQQSCTVLELKFTNNVPIWLVNIARSLGLVRGAYSKYGNSIRAFYEPAQMRSPRIAGGWR